MSRKQFIELNGATCDNWTWSWSFVNHKDRIVIFGAWEHWKEGSETKIFDKSWSVSDTGRKENGFSQSMRHIKLVQDEGYLLKTFKMIISDERKNEKGLGPAKIEKFDRELTPMYLDERDDKWYAVEFLDDTLDDLHISPDFSALGSDGGLSFMVMKSYVRRDPKVRQKVIERATSGCERKSCSDTRKYPGFLDVHHILGAKNSDRYWNCVALCPNCHREAHYSPDKERINEELLNFASRYDGKTDQL